MVCQTRVPLLYLGYRERLMEAIAGRVEDEQPLETVRREAMEEAGLRVLEPEPIATCWTSPASRPSVSISTSRLIHRSTVVGMAAATDPKTSPCRRSLCPNWHSWRIAAG
jgi:8-oxo-dGTP pyrophosphatase MutT (NUDIX family)